MAKKHKTRSEIYNDEGMKKSKFEVGDKVDIRNPTFRIDGVYIIKKEYWVSRRTKTWDGKEVLYTGWIYRTTEIDNCYCVVEQHVFPHNPPGDSFKDIMQELSNPVKNPDPTGV